MPDANVWNVVIGETFGTFILILLGNGIVANALLKNSRGNSGNWLAITVGWGFAVTIAAFLSSISNAHLNPAVTIGFLIAGNKSALLGNYAFVPVYIVCQVFGAMIGQLFVFLAYFKEYEKTDEKNKVLATFATSPINRSYLWNLITEIIATFVLVMVILSFSGIKHLIAPNPEVGLNNFAPLVVGITVMVIGLALGGPTGFAINPARDLGPRIMHAILPIKNKTTSDWNYAPVPIVGPTLGAIIAGLLVRLLGV